MRRSFLILAGLALLAYAGVSQLAGPRVALLLSGVAQGLRAASPVDGLIFAASALVLSLVGIVPGALIGIAGGAIFGLMLGFFYSGASILTGAYIAFLVSRSALRPYVAARLHRHSWLARLDNALTADSWRMVALLRISPVMPFSIASYALGLLGVRGRDYMLGTLASMLPLLGYVELGALGGWGASPQGGRTHLIHLFLAAFGACATLLLVWYATRLMRRLLAA